MSYLNEKLFVAVLGMSQSEGDVRQRLVDAYVFSLIHAIPPVHDWGQELNERLLEIQEMLTRVEPLGDEGSVQATVNTMTDDEVSACIEKICGLIFMLEVPKNA